MTFPATVELEILVTGIQVGEDVRWSFVREGGITLGQLLDVQRKARSILKDFQNGYGWICLQSYSLCVVRDTESRSDN